ncbi:MAG: YybH family protein [Bacteroidia bacterium]
MKNYLSVLTFIFFSASVYSQSDPQIKTTIGNSMHEQEIAWNKGDIGGFMSSYWNDDSLKFIGKSGITYGWKSTLDHYKKSYPDKEAMGKLTFSILSVEQFSDTVCYVTGKWNLKRTKDDLGGYYTLLWKKINGKWVIVIDHTS